MVVVMEARWVVCAVSECGAVQRSAVQLFGGVTSVGRNNLDPGRRAGGQQRSECGRSDCRHNQGTMEVSVVQKRRTRRTQLQAQSDVAALETAGTQTGKGRGGVGWREVERMKEEEEARRRWW